MDPQNIYDNPDFLAGYSSLPRQVEGLDGAAEWPDMEALLPSLSGADVVDLGCGFGWFSRYAAEAGAASVLGVDVSTEMLARARASTVTDVVTYRQCDLDELDLGTASADLVFSSLTLHYVYDLDRLLDVVSQALRPAGQLVFSVEHPIFSAPTRQSFGTNADGEQVWPLNNYLIEGERVTTWFVEGVRKQHRTIASYVNAVVRSALAVDRILEWGPSAAAVEADPALAVDLHRPWFLIVRAARPLA